MARGKYHIKELVAVLSKRCRTSKIRAMSQSSVVFFFLFVGFLFTPTLPFALKTSVKVPSHWGLASSGLQATTSFIPSLSEATRWNCRITFTTNSLRTRNNKVPLIRTFVTDDLLFTPLEGYEPPTGSAAPRTAEGGSLIREIKYKLSEDPDDQKDGLWIWGLFKEPLYPFCLIEVETAAYSMGEDMLDAMKLYAKLPHKMEKVKGDGEGRREVSERVRVAKRRSTSGSKTPLVTIYTLPILTLSIQSPVRLASLVAGEARLCGLDQEDSDGDEGRPCWSGESDVIR